MKIFINFKNIASTILRKLSLSRESKIRLKNQVKKLKKINLKRLSFTGIPLVAVIVVFIMVLNSIFSDEVVVKVFAQELMKEITPQKVQTVELKDNFIQSTSDFSVDLFKQSYTKGKNSLVSPTSAYLALGMTANGADGNTLKEFETLLGKYSINIKDLNTYYGTISKRFTKSDTSKLYIANSIWYKENLDIKKDFLQINADYYNTGAYKTDFNNQKTIKYVNNWVKRSTDNTISKLIDKVDASTVMNLINAVYFQAQWKKLYEANDIRKDYFMLEGGAKQSVTFMHSSEDWYLKDDQVEGFIKPYKNEKYSFVALLPNETVNIDSYINSLTGESFVKLLKSKSKETVAATLPKFKAEDKIQLIEPLKKMGLKDCFDAGKANFTKMVSSNPGGVFVRDILHKTTITVDAEGTKAATSTEVELARGEVTSTAPHNITLNRAFVYAIIDNETNLPLFIGTVIKPQ
ncbi:MAG: serpin family protein [Clostridiaceae bacterium]|nr:serpin family protein [Clostridiaceae bacterium]